MDEYSYKALEFLHGINLEYPESNNNIRKDTQNRIIVYRIDNSYNYYMHIFSLNKKNIWEETVKKYIPDE